MSGKQLWSAPFLEEGVAVPAPELAAARASLRSDGFTVLREAVPAPAVRAALRRLNLAIRFEGLTPTQIESWQFATFFPHLRWEPEIWAVLPEAAAGLLSWREGDQWADPQILLRFPDEAQDWVLEPHVDSLPPWAAGRVYRGVVGVALTTASEEDGAVQVWPGSHRGEDRPTQVIPLQAGDALVMHPHLGHTGRLNLGPTVRAAVYFRLLTAEPDTE
jgi:hypothetical protein